VRSALRFPEEKSAAHILTACGVDQDAYTALASFRP